jgi:hypothetical protein
MGLFGSLFGVSKMNADPDQQHLARMFIEAAESGDMRKHVELTNWLIKQPWNASETRNRISHALSIVKISRFRPPTRARRKSDGGYTMLLIG